MYTSVRVLNHRDFQLLWLFGEVAKIMSTFGYVLTGTCDSPVQYEFLFDSEPTVEPSTEELTKIFRQLTDFETEIERYDLAV